jgi:hypothetical protein
MPFRQKILPVLLLIAVTAIILGLLYKIVVLRPVVINTAYDGATIYFSANRDAVLFPYDCVELQWRLENIDAVYLGDEPKQGVGGETFCLQPGRNPGLRVQFTDETRQGYPLPIEVISTTPLYWLLVIAAAVMTGLALYLWRVGEKATLSGTWLRVEASARYVGIGLLAALLLLSWWLPQSTGMQLGAFSVNMERWNERTPAEIISSINGDAGDGFHILEVTPPDSVTLIPFRISHSMTLHAIAYPRLFYWVGDLEAYLDRYTGDSSQSFLITGEASAERLGKAGPFQNLYLLLTDDMLATMRDLELEALALEITDFDGDKNLLRMNPEMSMEELEALVDRIVVDDAAGAEVEEDA